MFLTKVYAAVSASDFDVNKGFGSIISLYTFFVFLFNFCFYIGWAIMAVSIMYTFAYIGQKLMVTDEKETFEIFSGGLTKIVYLSVSGLFLISASFLIKTTGDVFGFTFDEIKLSIPTDLF
jgi:hypothetical protein